MQLPLSFKSSQGLNGKQRGDFIIESLIGVLLMGIVSVGIGHVANKVTKTQSQITLEAIALNKLQKLAMDGNKDTLCNLSSIQGTSADGQFSCQTATDSDGVPLLDANSVAIKEYVNSTFTLMGTQVQSPRPPVLTASVTINGESHNVVMGQLSQ